MPYQAWEKDATNSILVLSEQGIEAINVRVNVADLQQWCQAQGRSVDGEARSE